LFVILVWVVMLEALSLAVWPLARRVLPDAVDGGWAASRVLAPLMLALIVGVVLTLLEANPRIGRFVPSPTAIGLGMLIPGFAVVPIAIGAVAGAVWQKVSARTEEVYNTPLASGFITGEALMLLALAVAASFK